MILSKISGEKKDAWVMNPSDGTLKYLGEYDNTTTEFAFDGAYLRSSDKVLIVVDAKKSYLDKNATKLEEKW